MWSGCLKVQILSSWSRFAEVEMGAPNKHSPFHCPNWRNKQLSIVKPQWVKSSDCPKRVIPPEATSRVCHPKRVHPHSKKGNGFHPTLTGTIGATGWIQYEVGGNSLHGIIRCGVEDAPYPRMDHSHRWWSCQPKQEPLRYISKQVFGFWHQIFKESWIPTEKSQPSRKAVRSFWVVSEPPYPAKIADQLKKMRTTTGKPKLGG